MNQKTILAIAICAAVLGAGISGAIMSDRKAKAAAARAESAQAAADEAAANARAAERTAAAEAEKRRAAEASQKAKADELEAAKAAKAKAASDERAAADRKAAAASDAAAEQAKADIARAARDEARAKAKEADAKAAEAKSSAAEAAAKTAEAAALLEIEKLKAEKILAEAKILELRKTDFETLARDLAEWKADLEERERALKPEKTIADLSWAGGMEDTIIDADGNVKKQEKVAYDPEKDASLPPGARNLMRAERLADEAVATNAAGVQASLVSSLEAMRGRALAEGRVIDAEFYRKTIQSLYPATKGDAPAKNY